MYRDVISIRQVSSVLPVGKTKVYELINSGHLQSTKIGRRRFVFVDSIESLMRAGQKNLSSRS